MMLIKLSKTMDWVWLLGLKTCALEKPLAVPAKLPQRLSAEYKNCITKPINSPYKISNPQIFKLAKKSAEGAGKNSLRNGSKTKLRASAMDKRRRMLT